MKYTRHLSIVAFAICVLCGARLFGQSTTGNKGELWTVFTPPDKRFQLELPGTPKENAEGFEAALQPRSFRCAEKLRYAYRLETETPSRSVDIDLGIYNVNGCVRSDSDLKWEAAKLTVKYVADDPNDVIIRKERFEKNGVKGWLFVTQTAYSNFVWQLFAQSKESVYWLSYATTMDSGGRLSPEAERIFNSFKINE